VKKLQRTDDNIMKILLGFFGATENLLVLIKEYQKIEKITYPQYVNYLSQVALCIELGMKSILLFEDDIIKTHDLKELYYKMPQAFHSTFENHPFPKRTIDKSLDKIKNIFEDFRYFRTEHLDFFIEKSILSTDFKIIFSQVKRLQNFLFIMLLLDRIDQFYNYLIKYVDRSSFLNIDKKQFTFTKDNTALLKAINRYFEDLKKQTTSKNNSVKG